MEFRNIVIALAVFILGVLMIADPPAIHWLTRSRYRNTRMSEETMERMRRILGTLFIAVGVLIVLGDYYGFA